MFLPAYYTSRSLLVRWKNTIATVMAIALVVGVFIVVLSLAEGLKATMRTTGEPGNVIIRRQGATSELTSLISVDNLAVLRDIPGIARDEKGNPLLSPEVMTIQNMPRTDNPAGANVSVRGVGEMARVLRPSLSITAGRWFEPGKRECVVGEIMSHRFSNTAIGDRLQLGRSTYTVVGHFQVARTAYESEIWGDVTDIRGDFRRENYSTVLGRLVPGTTPDVYSKAIQADKRLNHVAEGEREFYTRAQSASDVIAALGYFMAFVMGIGAAFSAMNAMYASISSRTREIGTLRVLGYSPLSILASFVFEAMLLALAAGVLGAALSGALLQAAISHGLATTGTFNFSNFSEIAFEFRVSPRSLVAGVIFALLIGGLGGLLPAFSASRMPTLNALKT